MKNYKKGAIIFLVASFGVLTGYYLKKLIDIDFVLKDGYNYLISAILNFSLMSVMFYEWVKILKSEEIG